QNSELPIVSSSRCSSACFASRSKIPPELPRLFSEVLETVLKVLGRVHPPGSTRRGRVSPDGRLSIIVATPRKASVTTRNVAHAVPTQSPHPPTRLRPSPCPV